MLPGFFNVGFGTCRNRSLAALLRAIVRCSKNSRNRQGAVSGAKPALGRYWFLSPFCSSLLRR